MTDGWKRDAREAAAFEFPPDPADDFSAAPATPEVAGNLPEPPLESWRMPRASRRDFLRGVATSGVAVSAAARESGQHLRGRIGASRRVWIAASTHEGEEEAVLDALARVREEVKGCRLILVPRHVERAVRIVSLVRRRGYSASLRTDGFDESDDVLVGDTMGELPVFYAASDLAFVGGSLVDVGGHNLLEPAALGIPALTGPHMRNFADLAASLQAVGAVRTVHGAEDLARTVVDLLRDPNLRHRMGEEGRRFVLSNGGARERTMAVIDRLLEAPA